jgi:putative DNA primase/helicase
MKIREIAAGKGRYILESMGFPAEYMGKKHRDCPLCKAGTDRWRYTDFHGLGNFICSTCTPEGGDFVELAMQYFGYSFLEVADYVNKLLGVQNVETKPSYQSKEQLEQQQSHDFLESKLAEFKPVTQGDPVWLYLQSRGINHIPPTIRYHPSYRQDGESYPCLVARMDNNTLEQYQDDNGVLRTRYQRVSYKQVFLTAEGKKANVTNVKKHMPCERDYNGCSVKLFDYFAKSGTLAVTEGIEKALQHYQLTKIPTWSMDNAGNMVKFDCPNTVKHLIIIADTDSSFVGQQAAYSLAVRASRLIGKSGYALESVSVNLTMRFDGDYEIIRDNGVKADYENYFLENV